MNWETGIDINTLLCVKQTACGKLLYSTGSSAWCSVVTERGGKEGGLGRRSKRQGIYVYRELIHFVVEQKLTHYKTIIHQFLKMLIIGI